MKNELTMCVFVEPKCVAIFFISSYISNKCTGIYYVDIPTYLQIPHTKKQQNSIKYNTSFCNTNTCDVIPTEIHSL